MYLELKENCTLILRKTYTTITYQPKEVIHTDSRRTSWILF